MTDQHSTEHYEWDELAAGHALYALEPDDEQRFLDHLAACKRCTSSMDDYRLVAAQLGSLADSEPDQPPSWQHLRSRVVTVPDATVVPLPGRSSALRASRLLAAAAAVVLLAGGGFAGWQLTRGSGAAGGPNVAALAVCEQQPRCQVIRLHTPNGASPAAVIVNTDRVTVVPVTLTAPPLGRTYALWQMPRDGGPVLVTEFHDPTEQTAATPLPSDYADTAAFAISLEPASTTPTRPTHVVAVGSAN